MNDLQKRYEHALDVWASASTGPVRAGGAALDEVEQEILDSADPRLTRESIDPVILAAFAAPLHLRSHGLVRRRNHYRDLWDNQFAQHVMGLTRAHHDRTARLHAAADEQTDAADHDELHAAGAVAQMMAGQPHNPEYIDRWIGELVRKHS